jgi:serine/threonine protein kinase
VNKPERAVDTVPQWEPGSIVFGEFAVDATLGSGGFGRVELVHSLMTGHPYAVKRLLRPDLESQGELLAEAERWIGLPEHAHIVACHFVRTVGSEVALFTEYAADGSLAGQIASGALYEGGDDVVLRRVLKIAVETADGIALAHVNGLLHLDVKPSNVLITGDVAKITDFGLSVTRHRSAEEIVEMEMVLDYIVGDEIEDKDLRERFRAALRGVIERPREDETIKALASGRTNAYASPEQVAEGSVVGRGADIWSWGLSVLEMFAGRRTWPSGTLAAPVLERLAKTPGRLRVPMPDFVFKLLARCFLDDAAARPQTLAEAARALIDGAKQDGVMLDAQITDVRPGDLEGHAFGRRLLSGATWEDPRWLLTLAYEAGGLDPMASVSFWPHETGRGRAQTLQDLRALTEARRVLEPVASTLEQREALASILQASALVHVALGDADAAGVDLAAGLDVARTVDSLRGRELEFNLYYRTAIGKRDRDNRKDAVKAATEALALARRQAQRYPEWRRAVGSALLVLAGLELRDERRLELATEAIEEFRAAGDEDGEARGITLSATTLANLGRDAEGASAWAGVDRYLASLDMTGRPDRKVTKARMLLNRASGRGKDDDAMAWISQAAGLLEEAVEIDGLSEAVGDLGTARLSLAEGHETRDRTEDARRTYAAAAESLEVAVLRDGRTEFAPELAKAYDHEATLAGELGEIAAANVLAERAVDMWRKVISRIGTGRWSVEPAEALRKLALRHLEMGHPESAQALATEGIAILGEDPEQSSRGAREATSRLLAVSGSASRSSGDPEKALATFDRALELLGDADDYDTAVARAQLLTNQAHAWSVLGDQEQALDLLGRVTARFEERDGPDGRRSSVEWVHAACSLIRLQLRFGDYDAVLELATEVAPELERWIAVGRAELAYEQSRLAMAIARAYFQLGDLQLAVATMESALSDLKSEKIAMAGTSPEVLQSLAADWRRLAELAPDDVPHEMEVLKASYTSAVEVSRSGDVDHASALLEDRLAKGLHLLNLSPNLQLALLCGKIGLAAGITSMYAHRDGAAVNALNSAVNVYRQIYEQTQDFEGITGLASAHIGLVSVFLQRGDVEHAQYFLQLAGEMLTTFGTSEADNEWSRVQSAVQEFAASLEAARVD